MWGDGMKAKNKQSFSKRHLAGRIFSAFDKHKLRSKMLFVYIFCVIVPVIVTNSLITGILISSEKKTTKENLVSITDAIEYELHSTLDEAVLTAKAIYSKENMNRFLETHYSNAVDYFSAYHNLDVMTLVEYGYKTKISDIRIYTDNSTIIPGGSFYKISSIENTLWYTKHKQEKKSLTLCMYYEEEEPSIIRQIPKRHLSLIRDLDSNKKQSTLKNFVKIDVDYNVQQAELKNANYNADVYIVSDGKTLFTNTCQKIGDEPFEEFNMKSTVKRNLFHGKQVTMYGMSFDIIAIDNRENGFLDVLMSYMWLLPLMLILNLVIPITVIMAVNKSICGRIVLLGDYFEKMKQENFEKIPEQESKDEIAQLIQNYNITADKMDKLINMVYRSKIEKQNLVVAKQQAELLALYSQINPHFLFNALESIRMRSVLKNENETAQVISNLAVLMRNSISWNNDIVSIGDEMEFSEAYLELQKYHFGEKMSYTISVDDECRDARIPKLTIVTFIENACVHGIEGTSDGGLVFLTVSKKDSDRIIIEIEDTGTGMDEKTADEFLKMLEAYDTNSEINFIIREKKKSIGVLNAYIRLKTFFMDDIRFEMCTEQGVGTLITINIPYK
jgi:two-component system sensor histidine kinase YesM